MGPAGRDRRVLARRRRRRGGRPSFSGPGRSRATAASSTSRSTASSTGAPRRSGFAAVENIKYFAIGRMSGVVIAVRAFVTRPGAHVLRRHLGLRARADSSSRERRACSPSSRSPRSRTGRSTRCCRPTECSSPRRCSCSCSRSASSPCSAARSATAPFVRVRPAPPAAPPLTEPFPAGELRPDVLPRRLARSVLRLRGGAHVCAFALTVLGGGYELLHHRIGVVFVSLATAMLALFGLAAYGASETIPLDVAIDAQGVTLGGARTPWRAVVSMRVEVTGKRARVPRPRTSCLARDVTPQRIARRPCDHRSRDRRLETASASRRARSDARRTSSNPSWRLRG